MTDYRSDRSASREGSYHAAGSGISPITDVKERMALAGFHWAWFTAGGFAGLEASGLHPATIHRYVARYRDAFGVHPDDDRNRFGCDR